MNKITIVVLCLMLCACQANQENRNAEFRLQSGMDSAQKKVILIMVDSMMGSTIDRTLEKKTTPALEYLINNGQYYKDLVAPFPPMSVVIESSIVTGVMPDRHLVPGLSWFNAKENRIVDYGTAWSTLIRTGFRQGGVDVFYNLNEKHLNPAVPTLFEELSDKNRTSGSVNTLIYRGRYLHDLKVPAMARVLGFPEKYTVSSPEIFVFGAFARPQLSGNFNSLEGIHRKLGLNDEYSSEAAASLIREGKQPDFMMIFFPDNDSEVHEHGPHYRRGLKRADAYLQEILNAYESWDKAIENNIFIVMGDHGQDHIEKDEQTLSIELDDLFSDYHAASLGEPVSHGEIAFAVNQRMVYVFDVHAAGLLPELADQAVKDHRVALAAWRTGEWIYVRHPETSSLFQFKQGGEWKDRYGQAWTWAGNPDIVKMSADEKSKQVKYSEYPDVLNQLRSAIDSHQIPSVILASKPGFSFQGDGTPTHPDGGEHGGLHKNDTLAALIIAGTELQMKNRRMVDLKEFILRLLTEK